MTLRVSAQSLANVSPSVALEKGAYYRTRVSRTRAASTVNIPYPYPHRRGLPRYQKNTNLAIILVVLVFACLACFGTAYYFFKTRWETQNKYFIPAPRANTPSPQVIASIQDEIDSHECYAASSDEKFLGYLPHSGFHNQRIAFENALVLARLLNRTLIVPPIRLGNKPVPYYPLDRLSRILALTDKTGLKHCLHVPAPIAMPPECLDYFEHTHLPWDWLMDLTSVRTKQKLLTRWSFSEDWFGDALGIADHQILRFRDRTPYQYRFVDTLGPLDVNTWYAEEVYLPTLAEHTQRLILFGTLFGSTRLRLVEEEHLAVRKEIREAMKITHPILTQISESISRTLGGAYLAIHLRARETKFAAASEANARTLWWTLLYRFLNMTADETMQLEAHIEETGMIRVQHFRNVSVPILSSRYTPLSWTERSQLALASSAHCPQSQKYFSTLASLAHRLPILYIATDLKRTRKQPPLSRFYTVFPCTFDLSSFPRHLSSLDRVINPVDGVPLGPYLLPFIDALVASRAIRVAGTKGSTFSYYIEDVLWRNYHELPIKQRG